MISVDVFTSDCRVWNQHEVYAKIAQAIFCNLDLTINLRKEGPAFDTLSIDPYIQQLRSVVDYSGQIKIISCNLLETHPTHQVITSFPHHIITQALDYDFQVHKNGVVNHFGLFIGRGNHARLYLSAYLYQHYRDLTVHTNHLDLDNDFYSANIGFEKLLGNSFLDPVSVARYIEQCPIGHSRVEPDKVLYLNHADQLLQNDHDSFLKMYNHFAVEIVCETYFTGRTFFPTEKIWRPILLKTPFIVQGPTDFLKNLKKLGFKTFSDFWDEGYDEDPHPWSMVEITRVIDRLAAMPTKEINQMLDDMHDLLDHNRCRFLELANEIDNRNEILPIFFDHKHTKIWDRKFFDEQ
jgi:hypothetical protein